MSGGDDGFEEEHEEHENHERYLVTYADMITLLMVLFIVLYALGSTNAEKFDRFQQGLQASFGAPALEGSTGIHEGSPQPADPIDPALPRDYRDQPTGETGEGKDAKDDQGGGAGEGDSGDGTLQITDASQLGGMVDVSEIDDLVHLLRRGLASDPATAHADVRADDRGVVIKLDTDDIVFASGQANLLVDGERLLHSLAAPLREIGNLVVVEGHTDSVPMTGRRTNWELSADRAARVVRELIADGLPAERLAAEGFADTRPIGDNATETGRAANRRVELVVQVSMTSAYPEPEDVGDPIPDNLPGR